MFLTWIGNADMDEGVQDRSFDDAWNELTPAARRAFELAHLTLLAGGLACGSVITDGDGRIVAEGRNRAYDPTTGTDPLEGTPLAHAEMNALARLATDCEPADFTIWSTQQPCSMCAAAISFVGIRHVIAVAGDPSDPTRPTDEVLDDVWVVLATVMFLIGPLRVGGADHPIVRANGQLEPEAVALAIRSMATTDDPLTD
jgi:tRNA(Arg) A34 adenosine deaminase TadA